MSGYENATSERGRLLDPISLCEVPVDQIAWIVLDNAVYSPQSVKSYVKAWEESNGIEDGCRRGNTDFRRWTRGTEYQIGAYRLPNPLRQGVAWSRSALQLIHSNLS